MVRGLLLTGSVVVAAFGETLREAADKHGLYVGTCISHSHLSNSQYTSVAKQQYSLYTAENACKFDALEPNQGQFNFRGCDDIRDFAKQANAKFRAHTLCWVSQVPGWVNNLGASGKRSVLQSHAKAVVSHYGSDAIAWDVVNEAVTDSDGQGNLKNNVWYPDVPDYLDVCFKAAREAAPSGVKLFYNDYGADSMSQSKARRVYSVVWDLVYRGIPIDGVGLQFHIGTWADNQGFYDGFKQNLQQYAALGLEVHVTELDISFDSWSSAAEKQQGDMYAKLLKICLDASNCKNFETWGFTDASTWISGNKHPLPFDENYRPKAAVAAMIVAMGGSPSPSPSPTPTPSPSPTRTYDTLTTTCQNAVAITDKLSVSSVQDCKALCDGRAGCNSVDTDGHDCYLKSHCEGQVGSCNGWCGYRVRGQEVSV